jgi:molybdopterin converting factor small subunit
MTFFDLQVLLFGRYAEVLGAETLRISLPAGATVADAVQAVRERPSGNLLPRQVLCAVNLRQAPPEQALAPGDELALLPPLAGG